MSTQGSPLFGIAYNIKIYTPNQTIQISSDQYDVALRCVFEVEQTAYQKLWFCTLSIYNCNATTTQNILQGTRVVIEAGFKNGSYGVIWDGPVFQPQWERENVTDFKTTLHCLIGANELTRQIAIGTVNAFTAQDQIVRQIAARCGYPIPISQMAEPGSFKPTTSILPEPLFGTPRNLLDNIAENNNMQWWLGFDGLYMGNILTTPSVNDVITYTPSTGLLGTPQQIAGPSVSNSGTPGTVGSPIVTQGGIAFRVALDPRMKVTFPALSVKLDNTSIRTMLRNIGQLPTLLDRDGTYKVGRVRHVGDTRGNDWWTEVTGFVSGNAIATMNADTTQNADSSQS
jgi:hypothetical protein